MRMLGCRLYVILYTAVSVLPTYVVTVLTIGFSFVFQLNRKVKRYEKIYDEIYGSVL
jgi:hypothetical protein